MRSARTVSIVMRMTLGRGVFCADLVFADFVTDAGLAVATVAKSSRRTQSNGRGKSIGERSLSSCALRSWLPARWPMLDGYFFAASAEVWRRANRSRALGENGESGN